MNRWDLIFAVIGIFLFFGAGGVWAESSGEQFERGAWSFGVEAGGGYTFDLPTGRDRTDLQFAVLFPNFEYNMTGLIGRDAWYQGALYWRPEVDAAYLTNHGGKYLAGFSPIMLQYKFADPKRSWAPNLLGGAGFSFTNWDDIAFQELGAPFEFLLHIGGGLEFFHDKGSYSINYRLFHVSNGGIASPNIGLNAHVFTLGIRF